MRALTLIVLPALMLLAVSCAGTTGLPLVVAPTQPPGDREDCAEILDTAFRSDAEREWFAANCSAWPVVNDPLSRPGAAQARRSRQDEPRQQAPAQQESPDCQRIRGHPYESDAQRVWFLSNCVTNGPIPSGDGPDRTNCAEINGTTYRSGAERNWFLQNCLAPR
jgi:hypothetical protein